MTGNGATMSASARLVDNIVLFARTLRAAGLTVGSGAVIDAVRAVEVAGITAREDLYWTLHAVFVKKHDQHAVFDQAFELFWRPRGLVEKMLQMLSPVTRPQAQESPQRAGALRVRDALRETRLHTIEEEKPQLELDARLTMSEREILQRKDFAQMTAAEIAVAKRLVAALVLPAERVRTRRMVAAARGRALDARRTMRASLRAGSDIIAMRFRQAKTVHPPIVAILDISGSMSAYSRIFLHFLHALSDSGRRVSTFVFGTRLTNITRQLRARDPDEALALCSEAVADWSGGTRIASTLHAFNRDWSRRVLAQGAVVLLITDGLERDTEADLGREMERLHKSSRRLVWLNPLLRFEGFEARAHGIRTMLHEVDEFRPIHSLEAMKDLVEALDGRRPSSDFDPRRYMRHGRAAARAA